MAALITPTRDLQRQLILRIASLAGAAVDSPGPSCSGPQLEDREAPSHCPGRPWPMASAAAAAREAESAPFRAAAAASALRHVAALLLYDAASELEAPELADLMVECSCVQVLASLTGLTQFSESAINTAGNQGTAIVIGINKWAGKSNMRVRAR